MSTGIKEVLLSNPSSYALFEADALLMSLGQRWSIFQAEPIESSEKEASRHELVQGRNEEEKFRPFRKHEDFL